MYYVYYLLSIKDSGIYIGQTNDIERRLKEHHSGKVSSTKSRRPLALLGYDVCDTKKEAVELEKETKKTHRRKNIKKRFENIIQERCQSG